MTITSIYATADDLDKVIAMGVEEGFASQLERLEELLRTLK